MLCSSLKVNQHFGGICDFHFHGQRIGQARNKYEAGSNQSSGFMVSYPRGQNSVICLNDSFSSGRTLDMNIQDHVILDHSESKE
jgi:hypothetical protein